MNSFKTGRAIGNTLARGIYNITEIERRKNYYINKSIEWAEYALDEKYKTDANENMNKALYFQEKAKEFTFINQAKKPVKTLIKNTLKLESWVGQPMAMYIKIKKNK